MNALKSGIDAQSEIIRGENSVDLETLAAEYHSRFQPATPEERWLVDVLIRSDWQLPASRALKPNSGDSESTLPRKAAKTLRGAPSSSTPTRSLAASNAA